MQQTAIAKFYLTQAEILEMRANAYTNAVLINGGLQFRVYELVGLINAIVAKNNVFSRLNQDDQAAKKKRKAKAKKAREADR